jgi:integrase
MLNKAEAWGYRQENTNPCRAVRRNPRRKCERFLSEAEMRRLGQVLAEERAGGGVFRPLIADAVTLVLLTGCRVNEILGLQRQDVRGHRVKLRDSKTGPRTVWLGDDARAVIDRLPRRRNVPWLFGNPRTGKALARITEHWYDIRERAGLDGLRLHDLRHTFASHAVRNKETLTMVGQLLGHRYPQSTARYAHWADEDVLRAAQQIGDAIERMMAQ